MTESPQRSFSFEREIGVSKQLGVTDPTLTRETVGRNVSGETPWDVRDPGCGVDENRAGGDDRTTGFVQGDQGLPC